MKARTEMSEHEVQTTIIDWLKMKRIFFWRANNGAMSIAHKGKSRFIRFGKKGSPDIFVIVGGKIFGIEVKAANGYQSQVQREFETEFTRAGGEYILAYSLEDVTHIFER